MEYRTFDPEDYHELLALWDICGLPYKPKGRDTPDKIKKEVQSHPEYWKAVYHHGDLIGIVVGTDDGRKGWINRLAVLPEHRNQGIGSRLVELLEEEFYSKDIKIIGTLIEGDNPESMRFFEKRGYVDLEIRYYSKRESEDT